MSNDPKSAYKVMILNGIDRISNFVDSLNTYSFCFLSSIKYLLNDINIVANIWREIRMINIALI